MAPNEESASNEKSLVTNILVSTNGPFCTPRSVTRSLTIRRKPPAQVIIEEMKALDDQGLGHYKVVSNNKVYYKPLPTENNKGLFERHGILMTDYKDAFCNKNMKYITPAQFNRLMSMSPDEQVLREQYGYVEMA